MIQDVYAENYTLSIFEGQGVRHPKWGYGVVQRVDRSVVTAFIGSGLLTCRADELQPARLSPSDLEDLQMKSYPLLEAETEARAHSVVNFKEAVEEQV